jgi:hypothetical protein
MQEVEFLSFALLPMLALTDDSVSADKPEILDKSRFPLSLTIVPLN